MGGKSWTLDEIEYVQANLGVLPHTEMATRFNRTPGAITQWANRRGLSVRIWTDKPECAHCGIVCAHAHRIYCSKECYAASRTFGPDDEINWTVKDEGYVTGFARNHPLADQQGEVRRHWHIFWEANDRADWVIEAKESGASIHHKNGIRDDNDPDNLELRMSGRHPRGWAIDDIIEWLENMGYKVTLP